MKAQSRIFSTSFDDIFLTGRTKDFGFPSIVGVRSMSKEAQAGHGCMKSEAIRATVQEKAGRLDK